jgi:amino acid adenylation domain-containing protein
MRQAIVALLAEPGAALGDDDDLIGRGLDSITIMRLANTWRRAGVELKFSDLIARPTLGAWWQLTAAHCEEAGSPVSPAVADETAPFELAPMQQAYWIGRGEGEALGGIDAHYYVELNGEGLEPKRLEAAMQRLCQRHAMLRTRFLPDGRQQVLPEPFCPKLPVHDLQGLSEEAVEPALQGLRQTLFPRRMAVEGGEVFDLQLSLLPRGACRVHLNVLMLVCDARSFQILLEELARLYRHPERPLPPVRISFHAYLAEQARRRTAARARAREYWLQRLADLPGRPQLPLALDPARLAGHEVEQHVYEMPVEERRALEQRCREYALTLPVVVATAFAEVIGAWSAEECFLLNVPVFDREDIHPDVDQLVGDFTNLNLLAVDVTREASFVDRARRLAAQLREHVAHGEYSGLEVLRDLARMRPGGGMMAPVVFTSAVGMGDLFAEDVRQALGTPGWMISRTPQVWLDHQVTERGGCLLFNWDVVEGLFPPGVIEVTFEAYASLLKWLVGDPAGWAEAVPPLLPPCQAEVRRAVNTSRTSDDDALLHGAFFERAAAEPGRLALAWGDTGRMTYGELAQRSLTIAAWLRGRGVQAGDTVAVTMSRGPEQVAAVLGVLAAGAAYVPVGPDQPVCRRQQIYENAGTRIVLTRGADAALDWPASVVVLPIETAEGTALPAEPFPVTPDSLAYVIYTSGSTGMPKGVEMTHQSAMNTIQDVNERFGVGGDDRVLAVSALEFDLSVYDIFGLLSVGGAVVVVEEEARREARIWLQLVSRWVVTVWNSVPALLDMLLIAAEVRGSALGFRLALISGDWIGLDLPGRLQARCPGCRFIALGGATEAAIWSNWFEVDHVDKSWRSIPYGFPLRNQSFRVVDSRGRDRPDGVPGELWIGGQGLARGYRGDPVRTAERFPERQGRRWYRTGDLGRYRPDGSLEFLGRTDAQLKIRGHRVEPGEIQAALEAHPEVLRAVAFAEGKGSGRIGAAVTTGSSPVSEAELKAFVADRLPPAMVPDRIVIVGEFPLGANGKVDRQALAELAVQAQAAHEDRPPLGLTEVALAKLWSELLQLPTVGSRQSFFALGGDSLMATRLLGLIRQRLGADLSLRQLLSAPTVSELAQVIDRSASDVEEGFV